MSSSMGIELSSVPVRELRPELDLSLLHAYELAGFYQLRALRETAPASGTSDQAIVTSRYSADAPRLGGRVELRSIRDEHRQAKSRHLDQATPASPRLAPPRDAMASTTMVERAEATVPEWFRLAMATRATQAAPTREGFLPYGAEPERIRQLIDAMAKDLEQVPLIFQYRQAGDLLPTLPATTQPAVSPRQVTAVYKVV